MRFCGPATGTTQWFFESLWVAQGTLNEIYDDIRPTRENVKVWINSHIAPSSGNLPFGGVKGSGVGREGGDKDGNYIGLLEFVEMKAVDR